MSDNKELFDSYRQLAGLLETQGSLPDALQAYEKCCGLAQGLARTQPDESRWRSELSTLYKKVSSLQQALGRPDLAVEALQQSIAAGQTLATGPQHPDGGESVDAPARAAFAQRFPRYWAWGSSGSFECWRSSHISQEDAQRAAQARAAEMESIFKRDGRFEQKYFYLDRPVREPLIEEIDGAVVSRNAYGCLIINSPQAMFVDIDFPAYQKPGLLKQLFGAGGSADFDAHMRVSQQQAMERVAQWTAHRSGWGWRAYRTFAGLRLLATHQTFDPESPQVAEVFEQLGADPLYGKLCRIQKCFRARLSPKPWRCGLNAPEVRWPWGSDVQARAFSVWQTKYQVKSAGYATCRLLGVVGSADVHPSLVRLLAHHDAATGVGIDRPLA